MYHQFLANALAYRGHIHEAYAMDRRLVFDPKASRFTWWEDPFMCLALLGVIPDSLAASTYAQAFEPDSAWPIPRSNIQPRHLRGLPWWQARRDTLSLARFALRAEQEARTQRSATGQLRGRYLHAAAIAYLELARGDSAGALRLFRAIPDTLCIVNICYYEKLIEARLLGSQGRARLAGEVLDRWVWRAEGPLYVLAMLDRARIAESLGERQKAMQAYQFVVDVWRGADRQLQPFVVEARTALTRMGAELP
jgi:tetratricopeptide (TPR) repeat protein